MGLFHLLGFAEQQLGKMVKIALPDFEIVLSLGDDPVDVGDLFLVEHFVNILADPKQAILVPTSHIQKAQFRGGLGGIPD